jgi:hypothetical protein
MGTRNKFREQIIIQEVAIATQLRGKLSPLYNTRNKITQYM